MQERVNEVIDEGFKVVFGEGVMVYNIYVDQDCVLLIPLQAL